MEVKEDKEGYVALAVNVLLHGFALFEYLIADFLYVFFVQISILKPIFKGSFKVVAPSFFSSALFLFVICVEKKVPPFFTAPISCQKLLEALFDPLIFGL